LNETLTFGQCVAKYLGVILILAAFDAFHCR